MASCPLGVDCYREPGVMTRVGIWNRNILYQDYHIDRYRQSPYDVRVFSSFVIRISSAAMSGSDNRSMTSATDFLSTIALTATQPDSSRLLMVGARLPVEAWKSVRGMSARDNQL